MFLLRSAAWFFFFLLLLDQIFLYQLRACTSPQKGVMITLWHEGESMFYSPELLSCLCCVCVCARKPVFVCVCEFTPTRASMYVCARAHSCAYALHSTLSQSPAPLSGDPLTDWLLSPFTTRQLHHGVFFLLLFFPPMIPLALSPVCLVGAVVVVARQGCGV